MALFGMFNLVLVRNKLKSSLNDISLWKKSITHFLVPISHNLILSIDKVYFIRSEADHAW